MLRILFILAALALSGCGGGVSSDPQFLALKANPPTEIPPADVAKLRAGKVACNIFNEGQESEYQTCWWPGGKPTQAAGLHYYPRAVRGGIYPSNKLITITKL